MNSVFGFVRRLLSSRVIGKSAKVQERKSCEVLNGSVLTSAFDEQYEMALVYCVDKVTGHCLSLSRFPGQASIEVMVVDQIVAKVVDLQVTLTGSCLQVILPEELTVRLNGVEKYIVYLDLPDGQRENLVSALVTIFEGKQGLLLQEGGGWRL